tara:strand:+ start:1682 stop:1831 length:150 start_codon:yes stop_codon:yes gene_type:complete
MAKTVMIVDDEQDNIATVKTVLEKEGYSILTASNADDCLKQVEEGSSGF